MFSSKLFDFYFEDKHSNYIFIPTQLNKFKARSKQVESLQIFVESVPWSSCSISDGSDEFGCTPPIIIVSPPPKIVIDLVLAEFCALAERLKGLRCP